jgi:hypothetical protein
MLRRLVAQTKAAIGSYALQHRGFTLTTAHNFAKSATTLTLAKKLGSGHGIKAMYSLRDRAAALEVGKAPITVRACCHPSRCLGRSSICFNESTCAVAGQN